MITGRFNHGNGRTHAISFIAGPIDAVVEEYREWIPVSGYHCIEVLSPGRDELAQCISPPTRCAFLSTNGRWTAFIENCRGGDWPLSVLFSMAERLGTECVGTVLMREGANPTACAFGYWDGRAGEPRERTIQLICDGRWVFHECGEPLPFEDAAQYLERKVADRFSNEMVINYAMHLGILLKDPFFYRGQSRVFELVLRRWR